MCRVWQDVRHKEDPAPAHHQGPPPEELHLPALLLFDCSPEQTPGTHPLSPRQPGSEPRSDFHRFIAASTPFSASDSDAELHQRNRSAAIGSIARLPDADANGERNRLAAAAWNRSRCYFLIYCCPDSNVT